MFSQLGPLFKATFRHAEESDTRQYIHHEDKKDSRKKRDERPEDDTSDMWEDSTGVSVDALRTFLINFLNGTSVQTGLAGAAARSEQNGGAAPSPGEKSAPQPSTPPPVNNMAARAVGAYQSMADKTAPHHYTPPPLTPDAEAGDGPKSDVDLLHAGEVRLIHKLIADLNDLDARGVQQLTIEKADSFLESLKNAVDKAVSGN